MRTKTVITISLLSLFSISAFSQEKQNYVFSYEGKKKTHTVGFYAGLQGSYTQVMDKPAAWYGYKLGLVLDKYWGIGFAGNALNYDHELSSLVDDGTYRMQGGFSGLFLEYQWPIKDFAKIALSWTTGMGTMAYQYNKEFAESREWYNEIIDVERFAANEFGLEVYFHTFGNWWLGVHGNFRDTSPIKLSGSDEDMIQNLSAGIVLKYGIF